MTRDRFGWGAAVSLLLVAASCWWWPAATWAACIIAGAATLTWLCRRVSDDPWLLRLALASYALRTALTLALFLISYFGLPIFENVQRGGGFWQIGADGIGYHETALRILDAWRLGFDLPSTFHSGLDEYQLFRNFGLVVAIFYRLLGPVLLHGLLLNAWVGAVVVVPAYGFVRRFADRKDARLAAGLIGFWPSSVIWSTQLLKDPWTALAIVTLFACLAAVWQGASAGRTLASRAGAWIGCALSAAALTFFRNYMGYVLWLAVALVMGLAGVRHLWRRRWGRLLRAAALVILIGISVRAGAETDFLKLLSPSHPERGHLALGARYEQVGDLERAMLAYIRVLELAPNQTLARDHLQRLIDRLGTEPDGTREPPALIGREEVSTALAADHGIATYMRPMDLEPRHWPYEEGKPGQRRPEPTTGPADPLDVDARVVRQAMKLTRSPTIAVQESETAAGEAYPVTIPSESLPSTAQPQTVQTSDEGSDDASSELIPWPDRLIAKLDNYRQGMIRVGGYFTVDKHVKLRTVRDAVVYLPRALSLAFLSPFPTQWFDTGGQTGTFRLLSSIEAILLLLLLPGMLFACGVLVRRHGEVGQVVVAFSLLAAVLLSFVIINLGILFRLRLQFILPLLAAIGISGLPQVYQVVFRRAMGLVLRRKGHVLS
jgi:hypothetical protein